MAQSKYKQPSTSNRNNQKYNRQQYEDEYIQTRRFLLNSQLKSDISTNPKQNANSFIFGESKINEVSPQKSSSFEKEELEVDSY